MKNQTKGKVLMASAVGIDVIPALVATLIQFPIWTQRDAKSTVSGLFVVLAFMACVPFYKQIRDYFKSPSAWVMWTIILVVFIALRHIIDEMIPVCFVGWFSNIIGAFIYAYGKKVKERPDKEPEKEATENT